MQSDGFNRGIFAVGDRVRQVELGVDRRVHGVRRTSEGEFLQFIADGHWHPVAAFAPAPSSDAVAEEPAPRPLPPR